MNTDATPDYSQVEKIEDRLKSSTAKLHQLARLMGHAEQIIDFVSTQRANILASEQVHFLKDEGVSASEMMARNSEVYKQKIKDLERSYAEAQGIKYEWKATMATFEAARSLLARQRETLHKFPE